MIDSQNLPENLVIREYRPSDAGSIKDCLFVLQEYVHALEPGVVATGKQVYDSYFEYLIDEVKNKDGKIYLAEADNKVMAFIGFFFIQEPYESVPSLYVSDLVVLVEYRGLGVGTKLLEYADNYAKEKNCKFVKITPLAKNSGAVDLYRKTGFIDYAITLVKKV